jgi:hypothetical protein
MIVSALGQRLPQRYIAEPQVRLGGGVLSLWNGVSLWYV